ncbi:MAG: NYN domain-containing protein [Candidatus Lokiarchaeota archaeon]
MQFLLKSEVEYEDPAKKYNVKKILCPSCNKNQIYKIEETIHYTKYQCWNKECWRVGEHFIVLKDFIKNEYEFNLYCEYCNEPYLRDIHIGDSNSISLIFTCDGKMCGRFDNPYKYNVNLRRWEGEIPNFTYYEDQENKLIFNDNSNERSSSQVLELESGNLEETLIDSEKEPLEIQEDFVGFQDNGKMPLLVMEKDEYNEFLEDHNNKVIILVDLPNLIRTLYSLYPHNFEQVIIKAHKLLIEFIDNYFNTTQDYLVRYFSKPSDDLYPANQSIEEICYENKDLEIFHMLKIPKSGHFSDIDNYLIANAVEILERCNLKGFVIVSSDKDYLPVMRIAKFKGIKSMILGINTSDIYEEYNIGDIKFLNVLKFFNSQ